MVQKILKPVEGAFMFQTDVAVKRRLSTIRFPHRNVWRILPAFLFVIIANSGAQTWAVSSPNSGLTIEAKSDIVNTISTNKNCYFRVLLGTNVVIDWSPLGVTTSDQDFVNSLTFVKDSQSTID